MVVVAVSVYILFVAVRGAVDLMHRSRVGWCRGVDGIRSGIFLEVFGMSVEVAVNLSVHEYF